MIKEFIVSVAIAMASGTAPETLSQAEPSPTAAGQKLFIRCSSCHAMSAEAPPELGPHLEGIVGRPAAAVKGFNYSEALAAEDFIWDEALLDQWLKNPDILVPGMCMSFTGLSRPEQRQALIEYMKGPQS